MFFQTLYKFVYLLGTYLKPHVAILDGITMGSGAGISLPGMFRVVTDKTVFAAPEAQMGFHPDAGASYYLSRLPGYLGEYLALTGEKLNGVEMIACGLATHYSLNARLAWVEERLGKLITDDPSVLEDSLAQYGDLVYPDKRSIIHKVVMVVLRLVLEARCGRSRGVMERWRFGGKSKGGDLEGLFCFWWCCGVGGVVMGVGGDGGCSDVVEDDIGCGIHSGGADDNGAT
ncbi:ATP-dependent caseinolytic (Clp) protease/crotonase family protein [Actinidia rufa]|uniref:3-hydroxyisobutyryl-CoA hydrolase n=1 Tax=Actinidia rufa TaxID=165716 RepID=A0A7J0GBW1_9ERIC|nr:ATP-dependent caseinolytic (Clp) protease/crotonase family protein [Actinidia rufa]